MLAVAAAAAWGPVPSVAIGLAAAGVAVVRQPRPATRPA
jgi:hypothetical protein